MDKIREGLIALFDDMGTHLGEFRAKSYDRVFESSFQNHNELFVSMDEMLADASGEEQHELIEEMASMIPDYAYEKMQKVAKRQRERSYVDYNLNMAVYVVPMISYYQKGALESVAKRMVELWNEKEVTTLELSYAVYEEIAGGFKKRLCFITTAVCDRQCKPDDCYELTTLRAYRDTYMMQSDEGKALVEEYYSIAPGILKVIDMHKEAEDIYDNIYQEYLMPCIHLIEEGDHKACRTLYEEMVRNLQKKYLHS